MKKFLSVMLVAAMSVSALTACGSSEEPAENAETAETTEGGETDFTGAELTVCTWGGSTGAATKELAADFEEKYGCTVVFDEVNANADRIAKIQSSGRIRQC